jgi:hypothetical protein
VKLNVTKPLPSALTATAGRISLTTYSELTTYIRNNKYLNSYSAIMAPILKKRFHDNKSQSSRKRQRAGPGEGLSRQPNTRKEVTTLDALPWTEVSLPGRFDNAEGFFGLEEISDVEVVRDIKMGKLEYRVCEWSPLQYACSSLTCAVRYS